MTDRPRTRQRRKVPRPVDPIVAALRQARRDAGLNQTVVAEKIGVTQTTLAAWETGTNPPDLPTVRRWTELFGMDLEVGGAGPEPASVAYARGWDDCAAAVTAAAKRGDDD